ncbi:MAG: hypothetical protein SF002_13170 [Alphaproteobacteria bacterium]|nr:hypothetical protein [Alphaproteobacteria bacterium]
MPATLFSAAADPATVRARFQLLRPGPRLWAIGAVHGDVPGLVQLHDRLAEVIGPGDRVVYLGNFLGIGPDPAGVLDEVLDFRCRLMARQHAFACDVVLLRGQQEEMWSKLMQLQFAPHPREVLDWLGKSGVKTTLASYGLDYEQGQRAARESVTACARWTSIVRAQMSKRPGHREVFSALKRAALTRDGAMIFVAAGLHPGKTLDAMSDEFWWGGGLLDRHGGAYGAVKRIVRGYRTNLTIPESDGLVLSVDGGAGRGGRPMAACLDAAGVLVATI